MYVVQFYQIAVNCYRHFFDKIYNNLFIILEYNLKCVFFILTVLIFTQLFTQKFKLLN